MSRQTANAQRFQQSKFQRVQAEQQRRGLIQSWRERMAGVLEHQLKALSPPLAKQEEARTEFFLTPLSMLARCAAIEGRDIVECAQEYRTQLDMAFRNVAAEMADLEERRASDICGCVAVNPKLAKDVEITLPEPWDAVWKAAISAEAEDPKDHLKKEQHGKFENSIGQAKTYAPDGLKTAFGQMVAEFSAPRPNPVVGPALVAVWLEGEIENAQPCCGAGKPYHASACDGVEIKEDAVPPAPLEGPQLVTE